MKYLKVHNEKCTGCNTCVSVCSNLYFKEDSKEKSCIEILPGDKEKFKISVCNQCGTCVNECPVVALTANKAGVVMINKKICVGCYACVAICPTENMRVYTGGIVPFKCTACGACVKKCPSGALEIITEEK